MAITIVCVIAATFGGIVLGFWLRDALAKREIVPLTRRVQEQAKEITEIRSQLEQSRSESAGRAGYAALAGERAKMIAELTAERDQMREDAQKKAEIQNQSAARISELETQLANEQKKGEEKVALLTDAQAKMAAQFEVLASNILEKKSEKFAEGSQKELGTLLTPLRDQLKEFRERVDKVQTESTAGVTELKTLIGSLGTLNQALTEEARNLTTALRGSAKTQGDWGEFILRDLLDKAGLREGEQYTFQQSFGVASENGERARTVRTDVIVALPGGRSLVIDSKVSLTAYTDYVSAQDDAARTSALKAHLTSVRGHVAGLSKAGYHRLPGVEAPDFVVLFVPIEPAFLLALQNDAELWAEAYKQGILLVGPTTLLYVIRIVNVLWQQERQARNVSDVMERGAELYDKFVGFVTDMEAIGDSLRRTDQSYSNAMKKLSEGRGNLVRQVEMLKQLGIRTTKSLPKSLVDKADTDEPGLLAIAANDASGNAVDPE